MKKLVIQDKTMVILLLFVAFFVGAAITAVFVDYEAEAKKPKLPVPTFLQNQFAVDSAGPPLFFNSENS